MTVWQPLVKTEPSASANPPFAAHELLRAVPESSPPPTPLVFASPHSGRIYPEDMMAAARLDTESLRTSEDAFVDDIIAGAPALGVAVIRARLARAYVDLNREPWELDPGMFEDELPAFAKSHSARVAAGLGTIARVASEGRPIYARKLTFAEAKARIDLTHRPYHDALDRLLGAARATHGLAILVDWHSMPAAAARGQRARGGGACDIVLGDRFGAACSPRLTGLVERELEAMGYRVARNSPYAGGYTTEHYGRPSRRTHALQIEINRALYMDEVTREPTEGLGRLAADAERLTRALAALDPSSLR
ncbi:MULTISPECIES: N-formylglutamate amidohydrolase [unclassified Caulobacter]|uniref:N-formylglutamate amidohydrolase n=1 Tax=unclassified Caulobacter TaxID=2648921 RepID=UPI000D36CA25|nr:MULTISPECIES: N-formylglutamate amidohydrolase [unclassified Caulobacter]PTS89842.1 N-formylglutamate amidohydrolase [Caulobacter sp. HMWF009]PTT06004.1 N-formylglutamate amidohydrolase [Caulobacter sp. HMWF025]